jgi:1-acyl-sn-glycerol-3-phosphate acyltransferase
MHRLLPVQKPPRWWSPKLSPAWVRFWRPVRRWTQRHEQHLRAIEVRGLEHLQRADAQGQGVLITPNHVHYADVFVLAEAADRLGRPYYFMSAWQVLGMASPLRRWILRQHGCFSVDRDGTDLRAFRQAVEILETRSYPLVIFPEGEM